MPLLSTRHAHPPHPLKTIQWVGLLANDVRMRDFLHRLLTADRPYLWLEGTYLGMRPGGRITAVAVVVTAAVNTEGRQDLRPFIGPAEA
ncbi:hypothetical protein DKT77_17135 [Meridianimarinicoccus roseus]|uniref:Mutator family transposase n=1 Tax=Meridianimarinicoccus roseus TaxID=2072018 RepID=A0A2V2L7U2_9RHOB|nr:transposase [Meridianimarinicoccus roseus]PWR01430.1 hypothetical protein DKT77_17135 [Meridianimarinicoccus roseus]